MDQLLTTKLNIPTTRPDLVPRPRLITHLNEGLQRKFTLISAPAGFGKTTLVAEWLETLRKHSQGETDNKYKIAWLSLDESENDLHRFIAYLIAALSTAGVIEQTTGDGLLSMTQSHQPLEKESILIPLINDIASIHGGTIIALDDYHVIHSSPINELLTFLIENLPQDAHLVITSREDPGLPLPRMRVRGQLTELRAADLRFTSLEAAEFLNQVMGLDLSPENISALERRTEGWIAGLQLAALSLQGKDDAAQRIESFSGSHRIILDYLIEEVLDQQDENIQQFLLRTSILDRLNGSLCDAVTDQEDSQQTLEYLEHANLFIVPLDDERNWYRYHHLFADLLRQRLAQSKPGELPSLHRRASHWFQTNNYPEEAIVHAMRGKDFELAVEYLESQADRLWQQGEHGKLRAWLERIPQEFILTKPLITMFRGYYLHSHGQQERGNLFLEEAEKALGPGADLSDTERQELLGRLAVIRAMIFTFTGDVPGMIRHANQALELLKDDETPWRSLAAITLGDACSYLGDMSASYQARAEALRACEAAGDHFYAIVAGLKLASTLKEQGKLQQTIKLCEQQMQQVYKYRFSQASPVGCLMALWGDTLAEINDLDSAILQAKRGAEIAEQRGSLTILGYSYFYLLRVLLARGDLDGAEEVIKKTARLNKKTRVPAWFIDQIANWQARIWLERGETENASRWLAEHQQALSNIPERFDYLSLFDYIMYARVMIAEQRLEEAVELLLHLEEQASINNRVTSTIEILNLQAQAYQAAGDSTRTMEPLGRALSIAAPLGFYRIFIDEGQAMKRLLEKAVCSNIAPLYAKQLLNGFPAAQDETAVARSSRMPNTDLIEPLSERETDVLQLIAEGLTNPEIASRLYLSVNTVKVHTRNIYGKLGVSNRTQAAARARSIGIMLAAPGQEG